ILLEGHLIHSVGEHQQLLEQGKALKAEIITIKEPTIAMPGFIDAHTHICYSGSRASDYSLRNAGKTYLEIAKAGGGIWDTVTHTRNASELELIEGIVQRATQHYQQGSTTLEVKSGYGLTVEEELKMLRAIDKANKELPIDLISTCLAAHMLPKDYAGTHEEYLNEIATELLPKIKEKGLSNRIDAFIEQGAFTKETITPYFEKANRLGFDITVHADQFSVGGTEIAVKHNAISADHLEASTDKEIDLLAKNNIIAVALPGATLGLGCDFAPARKLLDAGASLAIASDHNPGSAPMGDLLSEAAILGAFEKLTNAEVLAGITVRAAAALGLKDRGMLSKGQLADVIAFETGDFREILYHQGSMKPSKVWKAGNLIYSVSN
ncbi:MAG: imidazolonepropionase, partial [Eudoraea sp.]|nr:imidazolonepropionase [Eudoraea sp.]